MSSKFRVKKNITRSLAPLARRPFLVFLLLFFVAIVLTAIMYFNFQISYSSAESDSTLVTAKKNIFDSAKVLEYRDIFSILEKREADYNRKEIDTYPEVFGLPAVDISEISDTGELTKPAN